MKAKDFITEYAVADAVRNLTDLGPVSSTISNQIRNNMYTATQDAINKRYGDANQQAQLRALKNNILRYSRELSRKVDSTSSESFINSLINSYPYSSARVLRLSNLEDIWKEIPQHEQILQKGSEFAIRYLLTVAVNKTLSNNSKKHNSSQLSTDYRPNRLLSRIATMRTHDQEDLAAQLLNYLETLRPGTQAKVNQQAQRIRNQQNNQ